VADPAQRDRFFLVVKSALDTQRTNASQQSQKGKKYASNPNPVSPDRRGRPPVVGESLHPHGGQH